VSVYRVSVCVSALGLAISPERVVRSTSFLACGRGPPACVRTPGTHARQERRDSAESIMLYVLTVYPAVSWAPRGRAHELSHDLRIRNMWFPNPIGYQFELTVHLAGFSEIWSLKNFGVMTLAFWSHVTSTVT